MFQKYSFTFLIFLLSCAPAAKKPEAILSQPIAAVKPAEVAPAQASDCLGDADMEKIVSAQANLVDQQVGNSDAKTNMEKKECLRRTYSRGAYKIVVAKFGTKVLGTAVLKEKTDATSCLETALGDLKGFQVPGMDKAVERYKKENSDWYSDPDFGPAKWLVCDSLPASQYAEMLALTGHEVVHQLTRGNCLYVPPLDDSMCFDYPNTLPEASVTEIQSFPTDDPKVIAELESAERLLRTGRPSYLPLLEEINSQVVATNIMAHWLKQKTAIGPVKLDSRKIILLPLFMYYGTRYVEKAKLSSLKTYRSKFVLSMENIENLRFLFRMAETSYLTWLEALSHSGYQPKPIESALWKLYLDSKHRVFNPKL